MATKKKTPAKVEELERVFEYNGVKLEDPGTDKEPNEVKDFYAGVYPELLNADVKGPVISGNVQTYTFNTRTGTKG
ncbi:MAG: PRTRC system protein C [Victivallales bacterium]|nr:PRTRC system protein C [Victivallales bacterium]